MMETEILLLKGKGGFYNYVVIHTDHSLITQSPITIAAHG